MIALLFLIMSSCLAWAEDAPPVAMPGGTYFGKELRGSFVYRNIGYAKPPVDQLRWRRPVPELRAVQQKKSVACPQVVPDSMPGELLPLQEDCLYLNVWTPTKGKKLPVVFLIHGGGLVAGSGLKNTYDGSVFARKGVVFVAFNYRLGELGFGPKLEKQEGSLGLMDQGLALQWVVKNIEAFGGDPDRIFLMGHSKGAEAIFALVQSGLADGHVKGGFSFSSSRHFEPGSNPAPVEFWKNEHNLPWKEVMSHRTFFLYVPELPAYRPLTPTGAPFTAILSTLYDERIGGMGSGMFCAQTHFLLQFPEYVRAYYYIWHNQYPEHGAEIMSIFREDPFGKKIMSHMLSVIETGKPPRMALFGEPKLFRESRQIQHVFTGFTLPEKLVLPELLPGEHNEFEALNRMCAGGKDKENSLQNKKIHFLDSLSRLVWREPYLEKVPPVLLPSVNE